jgi:hypothetical protein
MLTLNGTVLLASMRGTILDVQCLRSGNIDEVCGTHLPNPIGPIVFLYQVVVLHDFGIGKRLFQHQICVSTNKPKQTYYSHPRNLHSSDND